MNRLQLLSLVFLLALCLMAGSWPCSRAEAAAGHELNYFQYENYTQDGRKWLRIELGFKGGEAEYTTQVKELTPKQLHVVLADTARGKVRSDIALDRKVAKYLTLRQGAENSLDAAITLDQNVADRAYRIYTAEPDRKGRKPYRLVIEIAENKLPEEYAAEKPAAETFEGLEGRRIVIDPGHGGSDSGAHGPNGLMEKDATLAISRNVADILRNSGAIVTMTRDTDVDVYGPLASDHDELQARVDVANADSRNEILVSIHCDAFTLPTAHGTGSFYYAPSFRGKLLAECIHDEIVEATGLSDRGARTARFYVLRNSDMPAALIETAFISNHQEELLLGDADFQYRMAMAICRGINRYFRMR